jgi:hypothetical protein
MATRAWRITRLETGVGVTVSNYAIPDPGEVIDQDNPTQVTLTWAQWLIDHTTVYGLTSDGRPRAQVAAVRAAAGRLATKAQTDPDWADLLTVLRWIADPARLTAPD